jgi:hypothetical protein
MGLQGSRAVSRKKGHRVDTGSYGRSAL